MWTKEQTYRVLILGFQFLEHPSRSGTRHGNWFLWFLALLWRIAQLFAFSWLQFRS